MFSNLTSFSWKSDADIIEQVNTGGAVCAEFDGGGTGKDHTHMIDGLKIENFRGFPSLEIPTLSQFTLLGGGNNVGKTSILEALFVFASRLNPLAFVQLQNLRGITDLPLDRNVLWSPFFWKYDLRKTISISPRFGDRTDTLTISFELAYSPRVQATRGPQGVPTVQASQSAFPTSALNIEMKAGDTLMQRSHLILNPNGLQMDLEFVVTPNQVPLSFLSSRVASNVRDDAVRFGMLDVTNSVDEILEFMKIVEPRLESLSAVAVGNGTVMHGDLGLGIKMPVYYMGDGVVRFLGIVLAIAASKNGIVLIDELGTGLHYSILSRVCEAIAAAAEKYNVQVIATTHSNEFLREAHKGLSNRKTENFSYIRLDCSGETYTAKTYDYEMVGVALEQGLEIR